MAASPMHPPPSAIRCIPAGICSWNFRLGDHHRHAELSFDWWRETGAIRVNRSRYRITKSGWPRGTWNMVSDEGAYASAHSASLFRRHFSIQSADGRYSLQAVSPFGRSMRLQGPGTQALIAPRHPFTRRSTLSGSVPDFAIASFAFWLTVLLWRRASEHQAHHAPSPHAPP